MTGQLVHSLIWHNVCMHAVLQFSDIGIAMEFV